MGERTVRDVMISQGGGGITVIYDMAPGQPQSQRVLRLENVNGMLEVIYDQAAPSMPTAAGGTPRLVQRGGGMYSVEYDRWGSSAPRASRLAPPLKAATPSLSA
jgi:hypothetical protein